MNSFLNRLNVIGFFVATALVLLAASSNITRLFHSFDPYIEIHNPRVANYGYYDYNSEYRNVMAHTKRHAKSAVLKFDLDVELSKLFTWNTKQIFVYIVAEYKTKKHPTNKVVIWDTVIDQADRMDADFFIENLEAKYPLNDVADSLDNVDVTLSVNWEITPVLGVFTLHGGKEVHSANVKIEK